jgi:acyl-CoA synthetase (AMP-forming)/AMP-acid ligase II
MLPSMRTDRATPSLAATASSEHQAVITGPWSAVGVPESSVSDFVMRGWERWSDRGAVIDAASGRSFSYGELAAAARRAASGLLARGLARGDVLALCCANSPEFAISYYGALAAGATVTTMSPLISVPEATVQLRDCNARWVITSPQPAAMLARAAGRGVADLIVVGEPGADWSLARLRESEQAARPEISPDELAVLLRSSGTTGLPKSVILTHRSLVPVCAACERRTPWARATSCWRRCRCATSPACRS